VVLAQGDDIAPIPGPKRVARLQEDAAADRIQLSPEQLGKLNNLSLAVGDHRDEQQISRSNADAPPGPDNRSSESDI
jgi:diketogulonate reductase-like aldo/keto reductase